MKILICKDKKTEYEAREKVTQMSDAEKKWRVQYAKRGKGWRGYQARQRVMRTPSAVKKWHRCPEREKVTRVPSAGKGDADTKRA